ncbi:conserved unknown protein [Ectocarpus siliculosus]|uniref:Cilia- and flagella-associated protein 157 n=1 Tax=Ectocarpus siliculosus TaxID=2880 RepID=D7G5E0_ECTSI|nr:conserved unknown protein [Ectocarpus siliculosus]|eukprot:CBJ33834.1 conserved unknown protein [Ectocarpus siliculosus]
MTTSMTPIAEELGRGREKAVELGDLDLDSAKLDDMVHALGRLELEKRGLLENIRVLRLRLADEKEDQSDVYYYLHKKLDDNYDVISALQRQLMVETADREKAEKEYTRQIEELEARRDEELGPLKEKLMTEEEQLNGMHEAAKNKQEADAKRARLECEIETTQFTFENDLNTERRKKLQEKQRVRTQVEEEIMTLSSELFSKKEVELADKTVRAKDNNDKLHAALQAKAKQAEQMMVMNQGLIFENRSLRNDLDLAEASEEVLHKRVRLYHELVISLKARLEQEACDDDAEDDDVSDGQELAELEESLASSGGGGGGIRKAADDTTVSCLDTLSSTSDTPSSAQVIWAGGACGALAYESVDELRVAVESLQRLHTELREEASRLTVRIEEAVDSAPAAGTEGGRGRDTEDPVVSCLIEAAEEWMAAALASRPARPGEERDRIGGGSGGGGGSGNEEEGPPLLLLPASASRRERSVRGSPGDHSGATTPNNNITGAIDRRYNLRSGSGKRGKTADSSRSGKRGAVATARGGSALANQRRKQTPSPSPCTTPSGGGRDGGALAAATKTPLRRRELFYHLVDAFREYQRRRTSQHVGDGAVDVGSDRLPGGEEWGQKGVPGTGTTAAEAGGPDGGGSNASTEFPPVGVSFGDDGDLHSASDGLSASVRTLCDFGPPDCHSVSTQTVAKHFPEKFASVRPARRLVVNSTFLTSHSTVTNSVLSASTVRSWGYGAASFDGQTDRRL